MSVYIVTHKDFNKPNISNYYSIQAGAYKGHIQADFFDDEGDNISVKNPSYCELTAIYWIWKHRHDDYIGIVHYRRYFSKFLGTKYYLTDSDIKKILGDYDVILPIRANMSVTVQKNLFDIYSGNEEQILSDAIKKIDSSYCEDYKKIMEGHEVYFCNMMICKRELFDSYCIWMFAVLAEVEKHINLSKYDIYQSRIYGFISERLLTLWVCHNHLQIKEVGMIELENNDSKVKNFLNAFRRMAVYHGGNSAMFSKFTSKVGKRI